MAKAPDPNNATPYRRDIPRGRRQVATPAQAQQVSRANASHQNPGTPPSRNMRAHRTDGGAVSHILRATLFSGTTLVIPPRETTGAEAQNPTEKNDRAMRPGR